jgi:hypothetical protein
MQRKKHGEWCARKVSVVLNLFIVNLGLGTCTYTGRIPPPLLLSRRRKLPLLFTRDQLASVVQPRSLRLWLRLLPCNSTWGTLYPIAVVPA